MDPANRQLRAPRSRASAPPRAAGRGAGGLGGASLGILLLFACGEPELEPTPPERFTILPGMPEAAYGPERLEEGDAPDGGLRPSRPRICETFVYPPAQGALDLLLVPDFGRSMEGRREEILAAFASFLDETFYGLRTSFRVGVLSAAPPAAGERLGRLVSIGGSATPFITCTPTETGEPCSYGDWELARLALLEAIDRAASRSSSLGLLAITRALDPQAGLNPGFLRPDAGLHVLVVSDADDLSCPSRAFGGGACRSFEGCGCEEEAELGGVEDFVRALRSAKGFGQQDRVRLSAWVATRGDPLPTEEGLGLYAGCAVEEEVERCATPWSEGAACALHAPRYAAAARALGGGVADLCREPEGLLAIGPAAKNAAPAFHLGRKALPSTLESVLLSFPDKSCNHQDSCLEEGLDCIRGRCGQVVSEGGADGWQFVSCSSGIPRNMVRFERSDRLRNRKIEICYDVDVGADPLPCH